jgi:hypothetical protein
VRGKFGSPRKVWEAASHQRANTGDVGFCLLVGQAKLKELVDTSRMIVELEVTLELFSELQRQQPS